VPVLAGPEPWGLRPTDRQGAGWPDSPWLTRIQADLLDLSYVYPAAGSNNGRISAETNNLTNTQVSYTYDELNRLATAVSATGGTTNWGLSFSYDVYGNRTAQTVTAGSAPAFSATFGSNNRMVGYSYDNNGNQLTTPDGATLEYDWDNRLTKWTKQGQVDQYQYHPSGWRMSKGSEKYLYGPGGQLLESYRAWNDFTDYVYFGGRLLYTLSAGQAVTRIYSDRLGSTRTTETIEPFGGGWTTRNYYPFGEEITSTANDQFKFASTYRDSATGLDYAVNRYYASSMGRFLSADPYQASGGPADPQSWNRYAYVQNDPANFIDPKGMYLCVPGVTCALEMAGSGAGNDGMEVVNGSDDAAPKEGTGGWDPCANKEAVAFYKSHLADAQTLAGKLKVPVQFVLAVSADESKFGTSDVAKNANNFFGLWAGAPGASGKWTTSGGTDVAKFAGPDGFLSSGRSFVAIAQRLVSNLKDPADPGQFFTALHAKFGLGSSTADYVEKMESVADAAAQRLKCP
jgi:RHS repeat-associated protein